MAVWVLGISALYHDASAALIRDGEIIAAAQEERFTRVKHDASLPIRAVRWLLKSNGLGISDIKFLVFYEKPLLKFERILATSVTYFPKSWRLFPLQMQAWLGDKLWLQSKLAETFNISKDAILFSEHHLSHAASAFYCSPFDEAAILTVDGVGEWATTSIWKAKGTKIEPISEVRYPHSLGLVYSAFTAHLGFVVNNGEYKVMGMSSYGKPVFKDKVMQLLSLNDDGSFELDLSYFAHHLSPTYPTTSKFEELFGPSRLPGSEFDVQSSHPKIRAESQHYANIAASVQEVLEDVIIHLASHAQKETGSKNVCLAGGVALNAVANMKLAESGIFENIFAQPAAGDAGGSIGAAQWAWNMVLAEEDPKQISKLKSKEPFSVHLGQVWSDEKSAEFLEDFHMLFTDLATEEKLIEDVAEELADGKIVGWMQGRFEWGPRALGNRSILADPRPPQMGEKINRQIKFREPFRPFAPMILKDDFDDWFIAPQASIPMLPYMLCTVRARPEKADLIPAVVHVDQTARVQVIDSQMYPLMFKVLTEFKKRTNVPILINTSFNLKGDPMVNSPVDAIATFLQSRLDILYIGRHRVLRPKRERFFGVERLKDTE